MKDNIFAENLKKERENANFTQKEMAIRLNIHPTTYAGYEQGYREPDIQKLKEICIILDISSDELLGLKSEVIKKNREITITAKATVNF